LSAGFVLNQWISTGDSHESFPGKRIEKSLSKKGNINVIELSGGPRRRGQIFGETLKTEILEITERWKEMLQKSHEMNPGKYIKEFLENTYFTHAIKKWTPHLLEEVKGISEGSGVEYNTIFAFQLRGDEEAWYSRNKRFGISASELKNCSALGISGLNGIPSLLAQNMDIASFTDGYEVLLHIKHQNSPLESFVFTYAGKIGLTGMNNHAVGICCNSLPQLNPSLDGLPVAYIVREIIAQAKYEDAARFIHTINHATGQNYIIGGIEGVSSFECSANKVERFIPYEEASRVYHTNHPIVNDDLSIYKKILKKIPPDGNPKTPSNSEIRFKTLEGRLRDLSKKIDVETVKSILSSHDDPKNPICRHKKINGSAAFTAGCLIMELSNSPVLHLAPGPPCLTKFRTQKF